MRQKSEEGKNLGIWPDIWEAGNKEHTFIIYLNIDDSYPL